MSEAVVPHHGRRRNAPLDNGWFPWSQQQLDVVPVCGDEAQEPGDGKPRELAIPELRDVRRLRVHDADRLYERPPVEDGAQLAGELLFYLLVDAHALSLGAVPNEASPH